jgi:ABC-type sulfate transport system permease component
MTPLGRVTPARDRDEDDELRPGPPPVVTAVAILGGAVVVLPLVALVLRAPWSRIADVLRAPAALDALRLSLTTTLAAVAVSRGCRPGSPTPDARSCER